MRQAELFFAAQEERVRREVAALAEEEMTRWRRRAGVAVAGDKAGSKAGDKAGKGAGLDRGDERLATRLVRDATVLKVMDHAWFGLDPVGADTGGTLYMGCGPVHEAGA